jgi:hypothetical protein
MRKIVASIVKTIDTTVKKSETGKNQFNPLIAVLNGVNVVDIKVKTAVSANGNIPTNAVKTPTITCAI